MLYEYTSYAMHVPLVQVQSSDTSTVYCTTCQVFLPCTHYMYDVTPPYAIAWIPSTSTPPETSYLPASLRMPSQNMRCAEYATHAQSTLGPALVLPPGGESGVDGSELAVEKDQEEREGVSKI